jgi:hypothetical protein
VRYVSVGVCLLMLSGSAAAQDAMRPSHVRAESADVRALIAEVSDRSATFRTLVDEIEQSNVIVYVRLRFFGSQMLDGRIGFLGSQPDVRFLAIELACPRWRELQMATLAHELQHALEIARASWVVGPATLARYYEEIGEHIGGDGRAVAFESDAARRMGARVRRELIDSTAAEHR